MPMHATQRMSSRVERHERLDGKTLAPITATRRCESQPATMLAGYTRDRAVMISPDSETQPNSV
jgi:hypothetical protein